jgi:hypothetical protein
MSAINLRLPSSLHEAVRELAKRENVSINQFITLALAEKISALMAKDYLAERAARGSQTKFDAALASVPDIEPDEADKL